MTASEKMTELAERFDIEVRAGRVIIPDGWYGIGGKLVVSEWEAAPFRLPGRHAMYPVRVETTGHTLQRKNGDLVVRVRITWVHDGEPETMSGGYMLVG